MQAHNLEVHFKCKTGPLLAAGRRTEEAAGLPNAVQDPQQQLGCM